jgi:hypothetical protein
VLRRSITVLSMSVLEWAQCDACDKWRILGDGVTADQLPDPFTCCPTHHLLPGR